MLERPPFLVSSPHLLASALGVIQGDRAGCGGGPQLDTPSPRPGVISHWDSACAQASSELVTSTRTTRCPWTVSILWSQRRAARGRIVPKPLGCAGENGPRIPKGLLVQRVCVVDVGLGTEGAEVWSPHGFPPRGPGSTPSHPAHGPSMGSELSLHWKHPQRAFGSKCVTLSFVTLQRSRVTSRDVSSWQPQEFGCS